MISYHPFTSFLSGALTGIAVVAFYKAGANYLKGKRRRATQCLSIALVFGLLALLVFFVR